MPTSILPPISESSSSSNKQDNVDGIKMQELSEEEISEDLDYENIDNVVCKPKSSKVGKPRAKTTRKSNRKTVKTEYNECSD